MGEKRYRGFGGKKGLKGKRRALFRKGPPLTGDLGVSLWRKLRGLWEKTFMGGRGPF